MDYENDYELWTMNYGLWTTLIIRISYKPLLVSITIKIITSTNWVVTWTNKIVTSTNKSLWKILTKAVGLTTHFFSEWKK